MIQNQGCRIEVYVRFEGDFDPKIVSQTLNLTPHQAWQKGDYKPRRPEELYTYSSWSFSLPERSNHYLDEVVEELLEKLQGYTQEIKRLQVEQNIQMSLICVIKFDPLNKPSISLRKNQISWLAALGAEFDVDIYLDLD